MRTDAVPGIVRAGGEAAIAAYAAFRESPGRAPGTRNVYASQARRFLRWAEARGRTLNTISESDLGAYMAELAAEKSPRAASKYVSPVRCLLGELTRAGVLAADPCPKGQPHGRKAMPAINGPEPSLSLAELKEAVRELGDWEEDSAFFQAGLVVLAPLSIGSIDPVAVAAFTGVPEPLVREFASRLLASGVWLRNGKIDVWGDDSGSGAASLEDLELLEVFFDVHIAVGRGECQPPAGTAGGIG